MLVCTHSDAGAAVQGTDQLLFDISICAATRCPWAGYALFAYNARAYASSAFSAGFVIITGHTESIQLIKV